MPAPPAFRTTSPFAARELTPRSQTTILPLTGVQQVFSEWRPAIHADTWEDAAVSEANVSGEGSIHGSRSDGGHPGSDVGDRESSRAAVSCRGGDEYPSLHRSEGANGDGVKVVRYDNAANAKGDDIDAVSDGRVKGGQDVRIKATSGPTDLINGETCFGRHPCGNATCITKGRRRVNVPPSGDGGGMSSMAVGVASRAELCSLVHSATGGLVAAGEVPCADELAITG
ncbi:hypothetical protein IEQ34_018848 [Dendrobium chrysotoxum]|uniref:Uncharacterized protein n=1 Tax=Dendrobium chrysotoxum TaxID=161865 RepID=A0AAV7G786_DENCH|nr:hypothetical protein IEQ34_018848 [Dendrobium chrysotoxum]